MYTQVRINARKFDNYHPFRSLRRDLVTLFVIPLLDPVPHTINTMYSIDFEKTTAESDSLSGKYGVDIQNIL